MYLNAHGGRLKRRRPHSALQTPRIILHHHALSLPTEVHHQLPATAPSCPVLFEYAIPQASVDHPECRTPYARISIIATTARYP